MPNAQKVYIARIATNENMTPIDKFIKLSSYDIDMNLFKAICEILVADVE